MFLYIGVTFFSPTMSLSKQFYCNICDKTLSTKPALNRHKLCHEEPQVSCMDCKKKFCTQWLLKRHMISHTKDTKHICAVCGARFASIYNLHRHAETLHLHLKSFKCDLCEKTFKRKAYLSDHIYRYHKNPYNHILSMAEGFQKIAGKCGRVEYLMPGRVAQSVGHLTRKSGVLGSIPGLATYFRFSFRFFFQERQLSVTGESMCTKYRLTA